MSSNRSNRSSRSNRFQNLSNPHSTKSNSESLQLSKLFAGGQDSEQSQEAGPSRGRGSGQGGSAQPVSEASSEGSARSDLSLRTSESRPTTVHDDPFPSFSIPSFEATGPKDPNQKEDREKKKPPKKSSKSKKEHVEGFKLGDLFYTSKWPGVTWHKGVINKAKTGDAKLDVIVRCIDDDKATPRFLNHMNNERWKMDALDHRYILKYIDWQYNEEGKNEEYAIFPKCLLTAIDEMVRKVLEGPYKEEIAIDYIGQLAQALS